jgi:transposase
MKVAAARTLGRENRMNDQRQWYAGIDWGSQSHCVCLTDGAGHKIGEKNFRHSGEGLAEMAAWLLTESGALDPSQVLVGIEVPHGPVVEALLERGFALHALNPKQLDRFRDRFTLAGAKDDSRDAEVMASALRTDPHCFRALLAVDPILVELREWSRIVEQLGRERVGLANRLQSLLWRYFPAMLELETDLAAEWLLELLELAPTPQQAACLHKSRIAKLLQNHRIRRLDAEAVITILRQPPLRLAGGTVEAVSAHVATTIPHLRLLNRQIKDAARQIDRLTAQLMAPQDDQPGQNEQRDAAILASLPGIGRIVLATLLAEGFDALQRRDYPALRTLTGVAPVTRRSGKSHFVVRRRACNPRLANAVYHWARVATQHDAKSRAKYTQLRSRGHTHGRALRSVADRLLNVACAMLRAGQIFDPDLEKTA